MLFRPYIFGIVVLATSVLATIVFAGGRFVQTQTAANFAAWKDPRNAESVPGWARQALTRDFRNLAGLKDVVSDSGVVPSTRYNAILAIGQLELTPGNPPVAYPAVLTYLVDVYRNDNYPYYLKYGALLGIVRHAILGIEPVLRDEVLELLLETVATELPLHSTPAVWHWFRLTALDGLTAMRTFGKIFGENGLVVETLLDVINLKSRKLDTLSRSPNILTRENWQQASWAIELASKAAKTLGDLDYRSATDIDTEKIADAFITLTKAVCDVKSEMVSAALGGEAALLTPATLKEQIVINVKICTQSVVWGMRSGFLTSRPSETSFVASLQDGDPAVERLNTLMARIVELTTFMDEGEMSRRATPTANDSKEFRFDLPDLREALIKLSETFMPPPEESP